MSKLSVCIFRNDLRLGDNPALTAAIATGLPLLLLVENPELNPVAEGAARLWWLDKSIDALAKDIATRRGRLYLSGKPVTELADTLPIASVHWNRAYTAEAIARDSAAKTTLKDKGIEANSHQANLLHEPWGIKNKTGGVFKVFTPFWKHYQTLGEPDDCLSAPDTLACAELDAALRSQCGLHEAAKLPDWNMHPTDPDWSKGFDADWQPGEAGANAKLDAFIESGLRGYKELRNRPDMEHVSRLSPHLAAGEISPRAIWHRTKAVLANDASLEKDAMHFLSEICWREFSNYLLFHFPDMPTKNWKPNFDGFPWHKNEDQLHAWQRGQTGYPMVDAGMRQLWQTGWMHNRVRMICASFLIKHLLIDWREGEAWFWDTLVDADRCNNVAGWQWVAGSGADASPFFRIFNPFTQGEKFDPDAAYVRRFVPELAQLPDKFIHRPWEAGPLILKAADVELGVNYPKPLVEHFSARDTALEAFKSIKVVAG